MAPRGELSSSGPTVRPTLVPLGTSDPVDAGTFAAAGGSPGEVTVLMTTSKVDAGPARGCGDWKLDPTSEECDGLEPVFRACSVLGFTSGALTCNDDCTWDTSECDGTEDCGDGVDNDGDGDADCADADCADACSDACSVPHLLTPGEPYAGTLMGRAETTSASCGDADVPFAAFETVAGIDGRLDVTLSAPDALSLSVRTRCGDVGTEAMCSFPTRASLDVQAGDRLFLIVSGSAEENGDYVLSVRERARACGDGVRDADDEPDGRLAEECDDDNEADGDGCSQHCTVESDEMDGDNDTTNTADEISAGERHVARIHPAGDVDYYRLELAAPASSLVVETTNLGDGACAFNLQDSRIEIFDASDETLTPLASDDDGGEGRCARATLAEVAAGTYWVVVSASEEAVPATFPYVLNVDVTCGDGQLDPGEGCDDENPEEGDGCNASCQGQ